MTFRNPQTAIYKNTHINNNIMHNIISNENDNILIETKYNII